MKTQYLVFGFVKEAQKLLPEHNSYWNIAELIIYTIMAYFQGFECWKYYDKDAFHYNPDKNIITKLRRKCEPCYGSRVVNYDSIGVHHWKIAITYLENKACIMEIEEASHQRIDKSY